MKLRKNIATSETGLIFNPATGDSFSVNNIGNEILSGLRENKSHEDITRMICAKYDVDRVQLERDLDDFFTQLYDYNLLDSDSHEQE